MEVTYLHVQFVCKGNKRKLISSKRFHRGRKSQLLQNSAWLSHEPYTYVHPFKAMIILSLYLLPSEVSQIHQQLNSYHSRNYPRTA